MIRWICYLTIMWCLAACGGSNAAPTPAPTFGPILGGSQTNGDSLSANVVVLPTSALIPSTPDDAAEPPANGDSTRYRSWMEEARITHPYSDTVDVMWQVMVCQSSGNANAVGPGELQGLFQYQQSTWAQPWNPYRDQPISDARAQIFATAKAWSDGNEQWWQVCLP